MKSIKLSIGALALGLLAACGGSGGGGGPVISGGVVKGPVLGSTVCAFALANGAKGAQVQLSQAPGSSGSFSGGCYVTGADGTYAFALPAGTTGDLLLEATGGKFCADESQVVNGACPGSTLVDLGSAAMSAVVSSAGNATVYTTPLSTAAVGNAGASLSAATFNAQFNTLSGMVGGSGTSSTPPTNATHPYLAAAGQSLAGSGTLSGIVSALAQGTTTFGSGSGTTPATVNAALVGSFNLKFYAGGGAGCAGVTGCDFTEGQDVPVVVHGDGRLSIAGKTLTNPFHRNFGSGPHLPEIIWLDAETNIEYALSDNELGHFNEINVGDASQPQGPFAIPRFIGQVREPQADGEVALTALAGTYPLGYQYNGNTVSWTALVIGSDGGISFTGGGPDMPAASRLSINAFSNIVNVTGTVGTGTLTISLYKTSAGALRSVQYDLARDSDFSNDTGVRVGTVAALPAHDGTAIPSVDAINGTVGGTVIDSTTITWNSGNANFLGIDGATGTGSTATMWSLSIGNPVGTPIVPGVYDCKRNTTTTHRLGTRRTNGGSVYSTTDGGRCRIEITAYAHSGGVATLLQGRFVAEFFDWSQAGDPLAVVNGVFNIGTPPP